MTLRNDTQKKWQNHIWNNTLKQKSIFFSCDEPHSCSRSCILSRGERYKFSSPKLREAQVQSLKIQWGRLFLCTKSYTSPNVFSHSTYAWQRKRLIQLISSPNILHLSKQPVSGWKRNHKKWQLTFFFSSTCQINVVNYWWEETRVDEVSQLRSASLIQSL